MRHDDPAAIALAADEQRDHARAAARGKRLVALADAVVSALLAAGILADPGAATVLVFGVLSDHLYGNHAIDVPTLRRGR